MANIKDIIKEIGETKWHTNNEQQMKVVQLLKFVATSDDSLSNKFMEKLSNASETIAKSLLSGGDDKKEEKNESYSISYANNLLDGMDDNTSIPKKSKASSTVNRASQLL